MGKRRYVLPIEIEADPTQAEVTSYAGMLPYLELWSAMGMPKAIDDQVSICGSQGWLDRQMVQTLMLLNVSGGDCVSDVDRLESDAGLCSFVRSGELDGLPRELRREHQRRFRKGRTRTFPAATQVYSFLESCHDDCEELSRIEGRAFIPRPNEHLRSLVALNDVLVSRVQGVRHKSRATLDSDATLVETYTHNAKHCYKGYRAYQPFNIWWAEQELVLHSEFRDGNVPAGYDVIRVMGDALRRLPGGVTGVYTRHDSASYQIDFLAWCERESEHPEYGRILFSISVPICHEFRAGVAGITEWSPECRVVRGKEYPTNREWAEVVYVPNSQAVLSDIKEPFRFLAIRERLGDQMLMTELSDQASLPFPVMEMDRVSYKLAGIVTNRREMPANELIQWHYARCGKSEEAHSIMKEDFAGGKLPSAKFGANAAWWALMILSMNFEMAMKRLVLGDDWRKKRMKAENLYLWAFGGFGFR